MILSKAREYLSRFQGMAKFLREPADLARARRVIESGLALRTQHFLAMAEQRIYANPRSPYRPLLLHAGIELADLRRMVQESGLEGTLEQLYDAGVYITLAEFKGREPVRRNGLEFPVQESDFDNSSLGREFAWSSSGTRGAPARIWFSDDYLIREAHYFPLFLMAHGVEDRPVIGWRPDFFAKYYVKAGKTPVAWYTQRRRTWDRESIDNFVLEGLSWIAARWVGRPLPWSGLIERKDVLKVATWLAAQKRRGPPALVDTNVSSSVRLCLAALDRGLDISGTVFRVGGEPLTRPKADVLASAGTRAIDLYACMELSWVGFACPAGRTHDDLHLAMEKVGAITREKTIAPGLSVQAFYFTNYLPDGPRTMLNVEIGDYGTLEERSCGCPWEELGYSKHMVGMHSYEKLTSEGVTFLGADLHHVLEEVLPARFGGSPIDYQFLEEEEAGMSKVSLLVAPHVGGIDEREVVETVLKTLEAVPGGREMTDQWRQGQTLRVVRREPYVTTTAKILPLHILRAGQKETAPFR